MGRRSSISEKLWVIEISCKLLVSINYSEVENVAFVSLIMVTSVLSLSVSVNWEVFETELWKSCGKFRKSKWKKSWKFPFLAESQKPTNFVLFFQFSSFPFSSHAHRESQHHRPSQLFCVFIFVNMRMKYFILKNVPKFILLTSIGGAGFFFGRKSVEPSPFCVRL